MIVSFRSRETEEIFNDLKPRRFPSDIFQVARRKLLMIHAARKIDDLRSPPGNRLELLKGNRRGQYSIRINDQWRVCFEWRLFYDDD